MNNTQGWLTLSHEEVLSALGILRLPLPLGLGENPTAGYTEETLNIAMTVALGSLMAHALADRQGEDFVLAADINAHLIVAVLAESCLLVNGDAHGMSSTAYYYINDGSVLGHTSPKERVHRFEFKAGIAAAIDESLQEIIPYAGVQSGFAFEIDPMALSIAVEALTAGQSLSASSIMRQVGVDQPTIAAFIGSLGLKPVRYAFMAISGLRTPEPTMHSLVVIQGVEATWCARSLQSPAGEMLSVTVVSRDELALQLAELTQELVA